jgi:hypothetical protein
VLEIVAVVAASVAIVMGALKWDDNWRKKRGQRRARAQLWWPHGCPEHTHVRVHPHPFDWAVADDW